MREDRHNGDTHDIRDSDVLQLTDLVTVETGGRLRAREDSPGLRLRPQREPTQAVGGRGAFGTDRIQRACTPAGDWGRTSPASVVELHLPMMLADM